MFTDTTHFLSDGLFRCSSTPRRDPDVVKIEQKIKKIHARKKHKENFKKIEELQNIYQSNPIEKEGSLTLPKETEGFQESLSMSDMGNKFNYIMDMGSEGFALAIEYFNMFINDVFLYIPENSRKTIHQYSQQINKRLSVENKEVREKDATVMTNVVMNLLVFPLCVIISYNWFFLNVMYDEVAFKESKRITRSNDSIPFRYASDENRLKIDWGKDDFLNFFLYFTIKPLEVVDSFLFGDNFKVNTHIYFLTPEEQFEYGKSNIPITMPRLFNGFAWLLSFIKIPRLLIKLIIFFFSIVFMYQFNFFSVVVDSLDNTKTTLLKMLCLVVILVFYFYYTFHYCFYYIPRKVQLNTAFAIKGMMIMVAWSIIYATIRLSIALASVNFSALVVTLYVWFHLIFGVLIYDKDNQGFLASFNKINKFIDEEIISSSKQCHEGEDTSDLNRFKKFLQYLLVFINDNLVSFGLLFILYTSFMDTQSNMKSVTVKNGFTFMLMMFAAINILMFIFPNMYKIFNEKRTDYKVANHPEVYVAPGGTVLNADTFVAPKADADVKSPVAANYGDKSAVISNANADVKPPVAANYGDKSAVISNANADVKPPVAANYDVKSDVAPNDYKLSEE